MIREMCFLAQTWTILKDWFKVLPLTFMSFWKTYFVLKKENANTCKVKNAFSWLESVVEQVSLQKQNAEFDAVSTTSHENIHALSLTVHTRASPHLLHRTLVSQCCWAIFSLAVASQTARSHAHLTIALMPCLDLFCELFQLTNPAEKHPLLFKPQVSFLPGTEENIWWAWVSIK